MSFLNELYKELFIDNPISFIWEPPIFFSAFGLLLGLNTGRPATGVLLMFFYFWWFNLFRFYKK